MPPKKAAGPASKKVATTKPSVNGVTKSKTTKKAPAKAPAKTTTKTSVRAPAKATTEPAAKATNKAPIKPSSKAAPKTAPVKVAANTGKKRKAADDEEKEPKTNGVKRQRTATKSATPAPAATKHKAAPKAKAPVVKKPKTKAVINDIPTERLDVYVFGTGEQGELGLGSAKGQTEVKRPRLNPLLASDKVGVVTMDVGGMHAAVLTHNNKILTWGVNDNGALGRDTTGWQPPLRDMKDDESDDDSDSGSETGINPLESTPTEIDLSLVPEDTAWVQVAATDSATFALTDDGLVYGWGTFRGNEGILGFSPDVHTQRQPILIERLKNIVQLAAGANHVLALSNKGEVFAWGSGQQNQLGRRILERTKLNSLLPTQFGLPKQMAMVGAGSYHSFAVHKNGKVYGWGLNSFGETGAAKDIGDGGECDVHHATVIESLSKFGKVTCISGGSHHTVAVTDKGELLVWGRLDGGQLGLDINTIPQIDLVFDSAGKPRILKVPTQVPGINAVQAAAGSDHSVAVAKDGKAYAWGFSINYQTGLGTDDDVEIATQIDNTATRGKKLVSAGCGGQFSVLCGVAGASMVNGV